MSEAKPSPAGTPEYARARATAKHFGVSVSTLWAWTKRPGWPAPLKAGPKTTLHSISAIEAYLKSQQVQ